MQEILSSAGLWLALAALAALVARRIRIPLAVCQILVGACASLGLREWLRPEAAWVGYISSAGALALTFFAGSELDPSSLRACWKNSLAIGCTGFLVPLLGTAAVARWLLGWTAQASWVAAAALSTASVVVVYAVLIESGMNRTALGKSLLAACYVNNLLTVCAMAFLFWPLSGKLWILPSYVVGMALGAIAGKRAFYIRQAGIWAFRILTPFYFLRAGVLVSIPSLAASPFLLAVFFPCKMTFKLVSLIPLLRNLGYAGRERGYYALMMSTGLGLGAVASSLGLEHGAIGQTGYSHLVAAVVASAILPPAVANARFARKAVSA
jgi:glutathione-regulated potassium-efflux system ancillary protein KefC